MQILSEYEKQFQELFNTDLTQMEIQSISKHSFIEGKHDLINKNLNFCLTPGHYNKSLIKKNLKSFNRKIKLKLATRKEPSNC